MKTFVLAVLLIAGMQSALAQKDHPLTGNIRVDLLAADIEVPLRPSSFADLPPPEKKSALRAAVFSAVLPGAGEFYAESYWKSAAFFGAEVALWVVYAVYDSKGSSLTNDFERYADQHWSVVKYAQWMETYGPTLNPDGPPCSGIIINNDPNLPPWERVDWGLLNACEESIGRKASTGFSHRLPVRPDQQYFELIGKYHQYNAGWDDSNATPADYLTAISARFREYRDMRGKANDFFNIASTVGFLLVANHVLSALDAAWSAAQFNSTLSVEAHLQPTVRPYGFVEFVPTARATLSF